MDLFRDSLEGRLETRNSIFHFAAHEGTLGVVSDETLQKNKESEKKKNTATNLNKTVETVLPMF